ncbi:Fc.00g057320.m01.CDS01 [Cosmosporella sp. VM-42]
MRLTLQSLILLGLSSLGACVYQDDVGHIDFHHALVGVPQVETTFFHRPRKEDKASLLYTLSDVGVLGAVNPSTGAVVWRQQVADDLTNGGGYLRAPEGENWVAAAYGPRVQAWDSLTGRNVWHNDYEGEAKDLEIMELTESLRKDVLVLYEEVGQTVLRRLHGSLGTVVWEFRETTKDIPLQVSTDHTKVYVVSLHGSPASYNLKVTALNTATGQRVEDLSIGTKGDVHGPKDVMFVGGNSAAPILAWTDASLSKVKVNVLGTKSAQEFGLAADAVSVEIHAPHLLQSQPHFLVHTRTKSANKGEVYHTDLKTGKVTKAYDLPLLSGPGAFSTSSDGANVYFTRVTGDELLIISSESHGVLARYPFKSFTNDAEPVHAVSEVIKKAGGEGFAVRSAVVTKDEDWVMVRNGEVDWTRPEGLTGAVAAVWAEIPASETLAKVLEQEAHTNPLQAYIHRVTRHIDDLQYLPDYLASIPERFIAGIFGGETASKKETLHRDNFGFNKIIVLATRRGRMYGLDTGNSGAVLWGKSVLPQAPGETLDVKGIFAKDEQGVVTLRGSKGEYVAIKSDTGDVVEVMPPGSLSPVSSTAIVDSTSGQWLLPIGADGVAGEIPEGWTPEQIIVVRGEGESLKGLKFVHSGKKATALEIWKLQVKPGQKIAEIAKPPARNPVASIGRVLGDRGVHYKYLNANTAVIAVADEAESSLSIQLVDTVSGQILAVQTYKGVDSTKPVSCAMAENWYACSFFGQYTLNDGTNRAIKGYQVVVSDLYESPSPNDRGPLGDADEFSSLNPVDTPTGPPLPWVVSQAFVVSQPLTTLTVSQTRQGIANRQLLAYLSEANSIVGLPRQILDPRRPVGRDPTAPEMEAEGLGKYAAAIEVDPRLIVSHQWNVVGVKGIVATPAIVESTSLVVAYGVDVFGTRVAPSGVFDILGKGFNKVTLVGTVVALFAGVMFLAPMVRRKQINMRWKAPM